MSTEILDIIATVGLWLLLGFSAYYVRRLHGLIGAQQRVVDTFRAHSDYVSNIHGTVSRLYDPGEIEKFVNAKVESEVREHNKRTTKAISAATEIVSAYRVDVSALLAYATSVAWYLTEDNVKEALENYRKTGGDEDWAKLISNHHKQSTKDRVGLLAAALRESSSTKPNSK